MYEMHIGIDWLSPNITYFQPGDTTLGVMVMIIIFNFVDFNSRNLAKSQCMGKYSIINMINKKVLGHITTCLQSKGWGLAL